MAKSKNEEIEKAKKELEKLAMNPEERELYGFRLKAIRDEMNIRQSGYADGMAAGEAKGKAEGEKNKSIEIARNMIKEKASIDFIAKVTGLSKEEIEALK